MRIAIVAGALVLAVAGRAPGATPDVVQGSLRVTPEAAVAEITIAPGWHVNGATPREGFLIPTRLDLTVPEGIRAGAVEYPPPVERTLEVSSGKPVALYEGQVAFRVPLEGVAAVGTGPVSAALRYQACSDTRCLPPRTLALVADARGIAAAGAVPERGNEVGNEVADRLARLGWGPTLLWLVLLGAALNLTPCVYPLISVTVAFFGGASGRDDGRSVLRAFVYVLGLCVSFSTLGAAAALTGSLFGATLQRPEVLGGLAVTMVALALANFGLYTVRLPSGLVRWAAQTGEGTVGAFFMGLTMGIVAAPCIGPVVATLFVYVGAQQSAPLGVALFFALGLGMGLPYVGLALAAGRLRRLPRGGAWLAWMEWLFGFVLLGAALHFATPLLPETVVRVGWAALLAVAGIVLGLAGTNRFPVVRRVRAAAGILVALLGVASLLVAETANPIPWRPFSEDALTQAIADGRPVLLDFEADWCLPCKEMDRTTFRDPGVVRAAEPFVALRVDATEDDERVKAILARFRVPGVPTYVVLGPNGVERLRLSGYVPADEMVRALRTVAPQEGGPRAKRGVRTTGGPRATRGVRTTGGPRATRGVREPVRADA
jgi:thiol:disulfide interchange protein DsbD